MVFDNRGMGLSGPATLPFEISDLAGDVLALLDALELERVHVLGISMGGMIAQELALAHPERIRTLSLGATYCGGLQSKTPAEEDLRMLGAAMSSGDQVIHGTADRLLPVENGIQIASLISVEPQLLDGIGHMFWWEQPERSAALVRDHALALL